jgi:hypothetical protein
MLNQRDVAAELQHRMFADGVVGRQEGAEAEAGHGGFLFFNRHRS